MSLGVVIGKFYPPHRGHHHLIKFARERVDRLVVIVCDHSEQKVPAYLRAAWLQEVHPECEIVVTPDDLPDEPGPWGERTVSILGCRPDWVFSSEDYGPGYALAMGAHHWMVDRERTEMPISGSAIRSDPLLHLEFVEPCVRAYLVPRVVIIGAESTGKTTLAKRMADGFGTGWVTEYGREYCELTGRMADTDIAWTTAEFVEIALEQQRRENAVARIAESILICDTNATATGTWHERYLGYRSPEVDAIGSADRVDLYLLMAPDVPFVQDGWRDGESIRTWMHEAFLSSLPLSITRVLTGSWEERHRAAKAAIEELLSSSSPRFN